MKKTLALFLLLSAIRVWALPVKDGMYKATQVSYQKVANLDGDWHFYWKTTFSDYVDGKDSLKPELLMVPGEWSFLDYPEFGYGLYVCKLTGNKARSKIGLKISSICNAFRLYVDGKLTATGGVFGKDEAHSVPDYAPSMVTFFPASDTCEIAIEVSNFHYREGGVNYSLQVGDVAPVALDYHRELITEAFITGALILMAFYFMGYYVIRRVDPTAFYFSLLCFSAALRMMSTQQILIRQFDIPVSWSGLVKIELISIALIPMFGALYLFSLLNEKRYRNILRGFNIITTLFVIYYLFSSTYWTSKVVPLFTYYALLEMIFLMLVVGQSVWKQSHPLAQLAGVGYFFVFAFGLNDILYSRGFINTIYLMPVAIFIYVFIQAIVLAKKYNNAFVEVEDLSAELQRVNKNQEAVIQHRTAELEGYNKIKDKIFSIISHDLRAPIATLSSVLSLAEDADDKTIVELKGYFKGIKRNVDNLNLTIDNMLVWSQGQINGIEAKPEIINLPEEVERCISLYSLVALQKEITLMHTLLEPLKIKADPAHLSLILRNTISNSLKFTNSGGSIVVSAFRPTPNMVKICITDNGIGIHPDKIATLLDPQSHYSTYGTQNEKGTGLGLMLCKEYAEQNGGSITIESAEGKGTKVCVFLPSVTG
jgi:signal transduction histidine kinase